MTQTELSLKVDLPELYPKQKKFVSDPSRFTWIEAGTKSGKTIGCIVWLLAQALNSKKKNINYWWVAPYIPQSRIAFDRLWNMIPDNLKLLSKKHDSERYILFPNKTKIHFKSGEKPDTLYGEDVYACVIDEASRLREESFNAIRSTLTATKGRAKIIGNVNGKKNWFYRNSQIAKSEGKGYYHLTSYDNPFIDKMEIEDAKRILPKHVFQELYEAIPTEDGSNPFGYEFIRSCVNNNITGDTVCYGIDLAKSFDYTVIIGMNEQAEVCYFDRFQTDWNQTKRRIIEKIGSTKCLIDSTGVGDAITEELQMILSDVEGYLFTQKSKQQLMELLSTAIQSGSIKFPEGHIKNELESFEFEYTRTGVKYSAPQGQHDDCVCALALAYKGFININKSSNFSWA